MIASRILIQAGAGRRPSNAALQEVPGVSEVASVAGPGDVIARAGTRDTGWPVRPGFPRPGPGAGTRVMSRPVMYR